MFTTRVNPIFSDTDALGHISNTTFPKWFEDARTPVFELFHPSLALETWPLILAKIEVDFLAQTYWGEEVLIKTYIGKIGNSSCNVVHEAWQNNKMIAKGLGVLIYFDYQTNKSIAIPDVIREKLIQHLID